jgi:outer membrane protein assembly factor BamB
MSPSNIFVGIKGNVLCLDRKTGQVLWESGLRGTDFVTLLADGDIVLAATRGEISCLEAATGNVLWRNNLPGQGYGLASIATATGATNPVAEKIRRDEESKNAANS